MSAKMPFGYCLNTSTIMGQKLPLMRVIEVTAKAGYTGIEPWIREMDEHVKQGGSLSDVAKAVKDHGLSVENGIGFFEWVVDDEPQRAKGIEEAKRNFEMMATIGGKRLAAPPFGYHGTPGLDLMRAAERYHALLEIGMQFGVTPVLEFWGASKSLNRLSEAILVAVQAEHPQACLLCDVFHMYKGGSPFEGLKLLNGAAIGIFHMNDYPANPPLATIGDSDRVFPGDGIAPLTSIFRTLRDIGYRGHLSLELFNKTYYAMDPLEAAKAGLQKMRQAVERALNAAE